MNNPIYSFYENLPPFFQNISLTLHGLRLYYREYGKEFERLLEQFERQQWFSENELEAYQSEQLRSIVEHAYRTVPFYRRQFDEHHLRPSDIRTINDIEKMPIIDSDVLTKHAGEFVSVEAGWQDRIIGCTSGTTGKSKTLFYDRHVCRIKNVIDWRLKRAAGIEMGDPIAYFMGQKVVPIQQKRPPFWRKNKVLNNMFFSVFHFSPFWYDVYIDALQGFGAFCVDGYPSTVSMFAEALLARKRIHNLKAAFVSSEILLPHQRNVIEKAFGCKVFNYYGMAERAVFATECEQHKGLHINTDFGHCELVDKFDRPVAPGLPGQLIITGWHNYTMPIIRYRTNDAATLAVERCSCGRGFPLLDSINGRDEDQLAAPDGRYLVDTFISDLFAQYQSKILESQIVQEESGAVIIKIVPSADFGNKDADLLIRGMRHYMGNSVNINIESCKSIPRTESGKFRWVISKVPRRIG